MRWLITQPGPDFSVHDCYVGWRDALRGHGEHVETFELGDRLAFFGNALMWDEDPAHAGPKGVRPVKRALSAEASYQLAAEGLESRLWGIRPDVLLITSGFFIPHGLLDHARSAYGTKVVVLHTEQPYELERELALAEHADLNLINDPIHLEKFKTVAETEYAPHAYRPAVHHPGPGTDAMRSDFAFVGTGYPSRRKLFEAIHATGVLDDYDVLLGGNWPGLEDASPLRKWIGADDPSHCLDNDQTAEVYRSTRASLNYYRREGVDGDSHDATGWAMGPREVELAACRTFFLRDPRPESNQLFPMLPAFTSPDEAAELLRWWLDPAHDSQREKAAAAAHDAIVDRTFTNHAVRLLGMFGKRPVSL